MGAPGPLPGHGVSGGRVPRGAAAAGAPLELRRTLEIMRRGGRGAGPRPRAPHRPPGSQAEQRLHHPEGPGEAARLRAGVAHRGHLLRGAELPTRRHALAHGAGAVAGRGRRTSARTSGPLGSCCTSCSPESCPTLIAKAGGAARPGALSAEPVPSLRELRPELPEELESLLAVVLAKDPGERLSVGRGAARGAVSSSRSTSGPGGAGLHAGAPAPAGDAGVLPAGEALHAGRAPGSRRTSASWRPPSTARPRRSSSRHGGSIARASATRCSPASATRWSRKATRRTRCARAWSCPGRCRKPCGRSSRCRPPRS